MRAMFSPEWLGVIQVLRSPRRGNVRVPASERVLFWHPEPSTRTGGVGVTASGPFVLDRLWEESCAPALVFTS
jgi:hypothetical protein